MKDDLACRLHLALGNSEECPGPWCAFWESHPDGGRCSLDRLGMNVAVEDPELARHLLEVRRRLEEVRDREQAEAVLEELRRILPPDLSGA